MKTFLILLLLLTGCTTATVRSGSSTYIDDISKSGIFDKGHNVSRPELNILKGALNAASIDLKAANKKIKNLIDENEKLKSDNDNKNSEIVELSKKISAEKVFTLKIIIALIAVSVLLVLSLAFIIKKFFWRL